MEEISRKADYLFEISYEVGNKVGGIYTVLKSKTAQMQRYYGYNYFAIGFYDPSKAKYELEPRDAGELSAALEETGESGAKCHFGSWNVPGKPKTILIDIEKCMYKANELKESLWNSHQIDSMGTDLWFDTPLVWSHVAGQLLVALSASLGTGKLVAQFHEWLSGAGLLHLKKLNSKIGTVFTTHATMLGRTMAGASRELYNEVEQGLKEGKCIDPQVAYKYGVQAKHQLESTCAKEADVFTTVSEITAREAEYVLGKRPDVVLPNGLDMAKFPGMEELSYLHKKYKGKITEFLRSYFSPYYNVNLDDPMVIFTSGRYEFRNKGLDILINALGEVNSRLKEKNSKRELFAFIFVPSDIHGPNMKVLQNISLYSELEDHVDDELPSIKDRIIDSLARGGSLEINNIFSEEFQHKYRRLMLRFKSEKGENPPLCAFDLNYDMENDQVLSSLKRMGLLNREEDRIKVIFYPAYLSSADGMLALDYVPMVQGSSMGVFPSYYEPWGYTPLENAANGSIAVTTDYGGFGKFILENSDPEKEMGVKVLRWSGKSDQEVTAELADFLFRIANGSPEERIALKNSAKKLSMLADWRVLSKHYIKAHNLAVERANKRTGG